MKRAHPSPTSTASPPAAREWRRPGHALAGLWIAASLLCLAPRPARADTGGLPSLADQVAALQAAVAQLQGLVQQQQASISSLQSTVQGQQNNISQLQDTVRAQHDDITLLRGLVQDPSLLDWYKGLQGQIGSVSKTVATQGETLAGLQRAINGVLVDLSPIHVDAEGNVTVSGNLCAANLCASHDIQANGDIVANGDIKAGVDFVAGGNVHADSGTVSCDFLLAFTSLGTGPGGNAYIGTDLFVNGTKIAGP